jgi:type II secretory pathway pseudopilin PulG
MIESQQEMSKSFGKRKKIILGIIGVLLLVSAIIGIYQYEQHKKQEELQAYKQTLKRFAKVELTAGYHAEQMIQDYSEVWYNTIFNDFSEIDGERYTDFSEAVNAAVNHYYANGALDDLDAKVEEGNELLKKLKNPPKEFEEEYKAAVKVHDSLNNFVIYAKEPSGTLQSFNEDTSEKDSQLSANLDKLNSMLN